MIKNLTSLRGVFILFVFLHHCMGLYPGGGSMAVAFFFVLGGFSMTVGYRDRVLKPEFNYKQYLLRRCIKFYPLHWLCLLAAIPLMFLSLDKIQFPIFVANASLLQTWIPLKEYYFSFNWVSWYLANTIFFAIVFPWVFKLIMMSSVAIRAMIWTLLAVLYCSAVVLIPYEEYHTFLYISPYVRLTDFVFGIFLALLYFKLKERYNKILSFKYTTLSIIALIVLLVVESCVLDKNVRLIAPLYWPLIILLIILASLSEAQNGGGILSKNRMLQRLGELSFTIFLTHQLVIRYFKAIFKFFQEDNIYLFVVLTLVSTVLISILIERYILKPITQWLTKRIQPSMIARS